MIRQFHTLRGKEHMTSKQDFLTRVAPVKFLTTSFPVINRNPYVHSANRFVQAPVLILSSMGRVSLLRNTAARLLPLMQPLLDGVGLLCSWCWRCVVVLGVGRSVLFV